MGGDCYGRATFTHHVFSIILFDESRDNGNNEVYVSCLSPVPILPVSTPTLTHCHSSTVTLIKHRSQRLTWEGRELGRKVKSDHRSKDTVLLPLT
jgi:hypothetical protein